MAPLRGLPAVMFIGLAYPIFALAPSSLARLKPYQQPLDDTLAAVDDGGGGQHWAERGLGALQPFVPGTPPLLARFAPDHAVQLSRRDCLPNGTNFCFDNTAIFCSQCGNCCSGSTSQFCCKSDATCCGNACCAAGQTCNNGRCFGNFITATVLSTLTTTATRIATRINTVVESVVETSYTDSVVFVTRSNLATQTDLIIVTVTAPAKRSVPTPVVRPRLEVEPAVRCGTGGGILARLFKALYLCAGAVFEVAGVSYPKEYFFDTQAHPSCPGRLVALRKRQQTREPQQGALSTTTVVNVVTQTREVTNFVTSAVTRQSTTTLVSTILRTQTRVINAQTTVAATSTATLTSRRPVTYTTTFIATDAGNSGGDSAIAPTASDTGAPVPTSDPPAPLPTPTIVGIAVGSAAFAALVALAVYLAILWRRRRAQRAQEWEDTHYGLSRNSAPYGGYGGEPRLSSIMQQRFGLGAVASHHNRNGSGFTGSTAVAGTGGGLSAAGAGGLKEARQSQQGGSHSSVGWDVAELDPTGRVEAPSNAATATSSVHQADNLGPLASQPDVHNGTAMLYHLPPDAVPPHESGGGVYYEVPASPVTPPGSPSSPSAAHGPLLHNRNSRQQRFSYMDY